ncbi:hypothetical protein MSP8886_02327 [Marinomonas spartinae]|uniref:Uncharacterized protein n=1 Tax=Marinomonas spartinae TaxID=1792290 RepID=A0A1A8TFE6_9GAMM|nr:hypothetical protein [Marinomonas spartinae]SBS32061.1 hypothetical protein MSP8886_02327 [Marinomonas spartinae]
MPITKETGEFLFLAMMFTAMACVLWVPIIWSLLTFLTPKKLLDTYFKEPHFTQGELIFMNRFPLSLLRTGMFGWVLLFPFLDKKRKIRDCHKIMPTWYRLALKFLTINVIIFAIAFFGIMLFLLTSHVAK